MFRNFKIYIIGAIVLSLLCFTIKLQRDRIQDLNENLNRQTENVTSLIEESSSIQLTNKELKRIMKNSEAEFVRKIDSVTSENDIKIKHLKKIIASQTTVTVKDTVYLPAVDTISKVDSLYQLRFIRENNCISASVVVLTIDPSTLIQFEKLEAKNESYFMVYKENKKWWQIFKKRKLMQKTVNTCGETTIKELEIL